MDTLLLPIRKIGTIKLFVNRGQIRLRTTDIAFALTVAWCEHVFALTSGGSRIFPRGGREPSRGGREHAKFSQKLHEIERIWTPRGGVRPSRPPLDPPMLTNSK